MAGLAGRHGDDFGREGKAASGDSSSDSRLGGGGGAPQQLQAEWVKAKEAARKVTAAEWTAC